MKERLVGTVRKVTGAVVAIQCLARGLCEAAPHIFEARDPRREAVQDGLRAKVLLKVGKVPISELEKEINGAINS